MSTPRFGPAGRADSFAEKGYKRMDQVVDYLGEFGLSVFEYQGGHGVKMNPDTAAALAKAGQKADIAFSFHAPYYISMASLDEEKRQNSLRYLLQSAEAVRALGGKRIIFHCGNVGAQVREEAAAKVAAMVDEARALLDAEGYEDLHLCPETMGRPAQYGTLAEILALCQRDERHIPCLDMGHLNAMAQGAIRGEADFAAILDAVAEALPDERAKGFHVHFSKIEFTKGGEKRHLTFADDVYGPPYEPFIRLCAMRGLAPVVICESRGTQSEDAQAMMNYYKKLKRK